MITVPQMKAIVNAEIAKYLTDRAANLKVDLSLGLNVRQKDVDKIRAYMLGIADTFTQKRQAVIAAEQRRKAAKLGTDEVQAPRVPDNAQE